MACSHWKTRVGKGKGSTGMGAGRASDTCGLPVPFTTQF